MLFDILFISFSLLIILISYFLIFRKKPHVTQAPPIIEEEPQIPEIEEEKEISDLQTDKSKKDLVKEAKKKEKKDRKEAMKQMVDNKEKKVDEKRKIYEEREKEREEKEKLREEEEQKKLEEIKKQEEEEYNKWKHMFAVEEKGLQKDSETEEQNLMQRFIDYIKLRKVAMLEDLAAEFKLSTKDVINRIKSLEELKILNGVIDERGKYIYITNKEMEAVINYIRSKGRVTRSDLLIECNKIIKLNPTGKEKEVLIEEENLILQEAEKQFMLIQQDFEKQKEAQI